MEIKSLETTPRDTIFEAFCEAFANYVIPMDVTREVHLKRWETAGVDFSLSFGVFDQDKLVAFILHVPFHDEIFNFGTGVIPSHRGQGLIQKIYDFAFDKIRHFSKIKLEVIIGNDRAISLYEKLGFQKVRELLSFQGELNICCGPTNEFHYQVKPLEYTDEMIKMRLFEPTSEASPEVLLRVSKIHETHELRYGNTLVAYATYTPYNVAIRELGAIDPIDRHLDQLLLHMKLNEQKVRLMNIEDKAKGLIEFLTEKGLNNFVSQYEMVKILR